MFALLEPMLSPRKPLSFHPPSWCSPIPAHSSPCPVASGPCSHLPTLDTGTFGVSAGVLWCLESHFHEPALAVLTQLQLPPSYLNSLLPAPHITWVSCSEPISQVRTSAVALYSPPSQSSGIHTQFPLPQQVGHQTATQNFGK